jgi:hypothetical protein
LLNFDFIEKKGISDDNQIIFVLHPANYNYKHVVFAIFSISGIHHYKYMPLEVYDFENSKSHFRRQNILI